MGFLTTSRLLYLSYITTLMGKSQHRNGAGTQIYSFYTKIKCSMCSKRNETELLFWLKNTQAQFAPPKNQNKDHVVG